MKQDLATVQPPAEQSGSASNAVVVNNLKIAYKDNVAVKDVSFTVPEGKSLVLLGQSGCGKTTTLRSIAGLERPIGGSIQVKGRTVFDAAQGLDIPPNRRNVGMVFQSYAVWPNKTVFENVAFPLRRKKMRTDEVTKRVRECLELTGLEDFIDRGASMLSGGQMQRVALARSLAMAPDVLLLDEPLSNLDAQLRERLRNELRRIQVDMGMTSLYVTHDQKEALALGDLIAVMRHGQIVQLGSPEELFEKPRNAAIASFMGIGNVFDITGSTTGVISLNGAQTQLTAADFDGNGDALCVRAEDIVLEPAGNANARNRIKAHVISSVYQGSHNTYEVLADGQLRFLVTVERDRPQFQMHDEVDVLIDPARTMVLPKE